VTPVVQNSACKSEGHTVKFQAATWGAKRIAVCAVAQGAALTPRARSHWGSRLNPRDTTDLHNLWLTNPKVKPSVYYTQSLKMHLGKGLPRSARKTRTPERYRAAPTPALLLGVLLGTYQQSAAQAAVR
jgi:hypothetical protein